MADPGAPGGRIDLTHGQEGRDRLGKGTVEVSFSGMVTNPAASVPTTYRASHDDIEFRARDGFGEGGAETSQPETSPIMRSDSLGSGLGSGRYAPDTRFQVSRSYKYDVQRPGNSRARMPSIIRAPDNSVDNLVGKKIREEVLLKIYSRVPPRKRLRRYLETSNEGFALDVTSACFSLIAVAIYIFETYQSPEWKDQKSNKWTFYIEVLFASFFLIEYLLRLYVAEVRYRYVLGWSSIVDLLTIIPPFLEIGNAMDHNFGFLRLVRILRVLRILRVHRLMMHSDSEVQRQVFMLVFTIGSVVFCTAGFLHALEDVGNDVGSDSSNKIATFDEALYLVAITVSTVGYGDLYPHTYEGKVLMILMLCFTFTVVPYEMNTLVQILAQSSVYQRDRYRPRRKGSHIIITGSIKYSGVEDFVSEFYHVDHGFGDMDAVLLSPEPPDRRMELLLRSSRMRNALKYVEGSPMVERDLHRACAHTAKAIFVLCNKFCEDQLEEDATNVMMVMSMEQYVRDRVAHSLPRVLIQLLLPESKHHLDASMKAARETYKASSRRLQRSPAPSSNRPVASTTGRTPRPTGSTSRPGPSGSSRPGASADRIDDDESPTFYHSTVCIDEMKLQMLGLASVCPGLSTLLCNLCRSSEDVVATGKNPRDRVPKQWQLEYAEGSSQEIYRSPISPAFEGWRYEDVAHLVYEQLGGVLFGIELRGEDLSPGEKGKLMLAPSELVLTNTSQTMAYIIASDLRTSMAVARYGLSAQTRLMGLSPLLRGEGMGARRNSNAQLFSGVVTSSTPPPDDVAAMSVGRFASPDESMAAVSGSGESSLWNSKSGRKSTATDFLASSMVDPLAAVTMPSGLGSAVKAGKRTGSTLLSKLGLKRGGEEEASDGEGEESGGGGAGEAEGSRTRWGAAAGGGDEGEEDSDGLVGKGLWGVLKKKAHLGSSNPNTPSRLGEALSQLQYMRKMYHIRRPASIAAATINRVPFRGHVVLCGPVASLFHLIAPLRRKHMKKIRPIVIMDHNAPLKHHWDNLSMFPSVYILEGYSQDDEDLGRANIINAHRAVIVGRGGVGSSRSEDLVDADTIFTYQHMKSLNPRLDVVAELVSGTNMSFLQPTVNWRSGTKLEVQMAPPYAEGSVFLSSMLDTIICQAFFNSDIVRVLRHLLVGNDHKVTNDWKALLPQEEDPVPVDASGRPGPSPGGRPGPSSDMPGAAGALAAGQSQASSTTITCQIPVPMDFVGRPFVELFLFLLHQRKMAVLGLYRRRVDPYGRGNRHPYVYTNPPPDVMLEEEDRVFVVCAQPPAEAVGLAGADDPELSAVGLLEPDIAPLDRNDRRAASSIREEVSRRLEAQAESFKHTGKDPLMGSMTPRFLANIRSGSGSGLIGHLMRSSSMRTAGSGGSRPGSPPRGEDNSPSPMSLMGGNAGGIGGTPPRRSRANSVPARRSSVDGALEAVAGGAGGGAGGAGAGAGGVALSEPEEEGLEGKGLAPVSLGAVNFEEREAEANGGLSSHSQSRNSDGLSARSSAGEQAEDLAGMQTELMMEMMQPMYEQIRTMSEKMSRELNLVRKEILELRKNTSQLTRNTRQQGQQSGGNSMM